MESKPEESQLPAPADANSESQAAAFVFDETQTLAGNLRQLLSESHARVMQLLPPDARVEFERDHIRRFDPWPDWTFRVAAEVFYVRFSTIPKQTIEDALRYFHFILLVAKIDGTTKEPTPKVPDLSPKIVGALMGHGLVLFFHSQKRLAARIEAARDILPADKVEEFLRDSSPNIFQDKMAPIIGDYLKNKPSAFIEFQDAFGEARSKTFDAHGSPKETPLTPIYAKILSDWSEIECLSGPKALCDYLSPLLGNQDIEDKYERVKSVCKRMRITFKPFVKGR